MGKRIRKFLAQRRRWDRRSGFHNREVKGGKSLKRIRMIIVMLVFAITVAMAMNAETGRAKEKKGTVYYEATFNKKVVSKGDVTVTEMTLKGDKLTVKGDLLKCNVKRVGSTEGKTTRLKKAVRTFTISKNFKAYGSGGDSGKWVPYSRAKWKSMLKNPTGLYVIFTVKNGKMTRMDFCS